MISLNLSNTTNSKLKSGASENDLEKYKDLLKQAKEKYLNTELGFKRLPREEELIFSEIHTALDDVEGFEDLVVIGIGGSDLGTRAIYRALNLNHKSKYKLHFTGDTTDPEAITDLLNKINLDKSKFFVVSKSGNTIEQASVFIYFRSLFEAKYSGDQQKVNSHFIFLTDPKTGTLRSLASTQGYKTIDIPSDVGGRFSVLSTVGMVPAGLVGINFRKILEGARDLENEIKNNEFDIVSRYVLTKFYFYKEKSKNVSVMMPYQYLLWEFAKWFQQLWGESLGKKVNNKGEEVYEGQTPVAVLGPVDQHSQLQLFNEGPDDKFITFIRAEESRTNIDLPAAYTNVTDFEYFKGHNFQEILNLEQETTAFSLVKFDRPNCTISISEVNEYYLGQLFYFFEVATTLFGYMLDINPFDQPGVELSKNAMYGVLDKAGYEGVKKEFEEYKK